jgi:methyl-accepting chemotaxis protein
MHIANMNIGTRLAAGFGLVLLLLVTLIGFALMRFDGIDQINRQIIEKDWVKAEAAGTINATTRANARRTMELLLLTDPVAVARTHEVIEANKKTITAAIDTLERLVYLPEGKALVAKLKQERGQYVASFAKVDRLIVAGRRDEAVALMLGETLPALDLLQDSIGRVAQLQKQIVEASGLEARRNIDAARALMLGWGAFALLAGAAVSLLITRSITGPIKAAVRIAQTVAAGDLTSRIAVSGTDETGQLLQALKDMNASLVGIVGEVRGGTDMIASATSQIAAGNLDLSVRTEQQASSLEETAASMAELASTVKTNTRHAQDANRLAASASEVARQGGAVVAKVIETMGSIKASSGKIGDIIGVIESIAFQTNILALNAAVEAARAGEQGRGFAVVATEVRYLAQRASAAAKQITSLIGASLDQVDSGTELANAAGTTMREIVASVGRVDDVMARIAAASLEQTSGIGQINEAIIQMDQVTQQNAALVEESAAAAAALQDQADSLSRVVQVFELDGAAGAGAERRKRQARLPASNRVLRLAA